MEIKLPVLGENVEDAEVLKVLVAEGDRIAKDQPLAELETDKATVEVPAPAAGVIRAVHIGEGDTVRVGQALFDLEEGAEAGQPAAQSGKAKRAGAAAAQPGATPARTAKPAAAPDSRAPAEGAAPGSRAPAAEGAAPARASASRSARADAPKRNPARAPAAERSLPDEAAPAAPSVRRLARELGVDIDAVRGSAPAGRISVEDVKEHVRRILREGIATPRGSATQAPAHFLELPDFLRLGEVERQPLRGVRRKTAENMTRAWVTIPHVTQFDRADVTELEAARKRFARRAEAAGAKLTITAIVIKVLASALRAFPKFNASLDVENEEIVLKKYVHVGVAVDTEHGLLVPVIRDADRKNVIALAVELGDLSERARTRKVKPDELAGSNITVTNLGGLGTTYFTPLINWPEVAVLGVGRAREEAVHGETGFVPRLILPLSVSYDHRIIDGADAARFLRWIAAALEEPLLLALEG